MRQKLIILLLVVFTMTSGASWAYGFAQGYSNLVSFRLGGYRYDFNTTVDSARFDRFEADWIGDCVLPVQNSFAGFQFTNTLWGDGNGPVRSIGKCLEIPHWFFTGLPASFAWIAVVRFSRTRRQLRFERNHCISCGYDLTGNTSGKCPECGQPVSFAQMQIVSNSTTM